MHVCELLALVDPMLWLQVMHLGPFLDAVCQYHLPLLAAWPLCEDLIICSHYEFRLNVAVIQSA